jgi:CBS domain-containing protein
MKVRDVMTRDVEVAQPGDTIRDVAQLMADIDAGVIPICDGSNVLGVVTDRDIVLRIVAQGRSLDTPATEIMSGPIEFAFEDDDLDEAAEKMARQQVRRLMVLDEDRTLCGILSLGDVARENSAKETGRTLEKISEPGGLHSH